MHKYLITLWLILLSHAALAHEMTPTYPKWKYSYMNGLLVTTMKIFNKRNDVEYYEVGVFDENWKPIPFVSQYKIINVEYLGRVKFDIYIREQDRNKAEYICSRSKMRNEDLKPTTISSRICSRFKKN